MLANKHESYVRATALLGFENALKEYDLDFPALLKEAQIDPRAQNDANMLISFVAYHRLLNLLEQRTGNQNIGLELVINTSKALDSIGPLALILKLGDTTGECVENALKFLRYHSNGVNVEVLKHPELGLGEFRYSPLPPLGSTRHLAENAIGIACVAMRFMLGDESKKPNRVTFQHSKPRDLTAIDAFFGCPADFNASTNSLYFDLDLLDQKTLGTDHQVAEIVYTYLDNEIARLEAEMSLESAISAVVARLLPSRRFSIELVAKAVAMHPKTLQRRLKDDGTSFSEILEHQRRQTALRLLSDTKLSSEKIAGLCGYANSAAFNHAFKKWENCTPGAFRKSLDNHKNAS